MTIEIAPIERSELVLALPIFPARARIVLPLKNLPVAGFRQ